MQLSIRSLIFYLVLLGPILASCGSAQDSSDNRGDEARQVTTFYLVRHAEKAGGDDPDLTAAGKDRAEELATILADKNIKAVYSTNTKRTMATALPTAKAGGLTVKNYDAGNLNAFASDVKSRYSGGAVLIVGHSNSTPQLANALSGNSNLKSFSEDDFGNLIEITVSRKGKAKVRQNRY